MMSHKNTSRSLADPFMVRNARLQSRGHNLFIEILIFLLIFLIASIVEGILSMIPTYIGLFQTPTFQKVMEDASNGTFDFAGYMDSVTQMMSEMPSWTTVATLFSTAAIIVTVLIYCGKIEKRKLSTLGLTKKRCFSEYGIGLCVGLFLFTLVFGLNLLFGAVKFTGISFQPQMLPMLILTLLGFGIQGASEEILCRGYFCTSVARWMPLWVGLLVNSIAFSMLHLMNPGISLLALLNLFLFGVFMTVYMIRRGNLWDVCAIHSIWNFAQGNIFGLQVSGLNTADSTIFSAKQIEHMRIWNGGSFGPEGGLCVTFVLVAAILVVWLFGKNNNIGQTADPIPQIQPKTAV